MERIIPEVMKAEDPETATASKKEVTARVENVYADHCPYCQKQYRSLEVNGISVYACDEHQIVMPQPD